MSEIAKITIGNKRAYEVDADPSVSGFVAPIGSLALFNDAGVGKVYLKKGSGNNDWKYLADADVIADLQQQIDDIESGISADYIPLTQKGAANGVATLGPDSKIPSSQIPAIAITDTFVVASEAAMLALSAAEQGDVAVRTDIMQSFILVSGSPATLANWQVLLSPTDAVMSVNGQTGVVVLTTTDIAEGTNLYFTEARVLDTDLAGFSDATQTPVVAADNVLVGMGKLQGQINKEIQDRLNLSWRYGSALADLHTATAASFFGTKSGGDFDISMYRNGVKFLDFKTTGFESNQSLTFTASGGGSAARRKILGTAGLEVGSTGGGALLLSTASAGVPINMVSLGAISLTTGTLAAYPISMDTRAITERLIANDLSSKMSKSKSYDQVSPADGDATSSISFNGYAVGTVRKTKLEISVEALNGADDASAMFEKTIHMDKQGTLFVQDDFQNLNAFASAITISSIAIVANQLVISFSGLAGLTAKLIAVRSELMNRV